MQIHDQQVYLRAVESLSLVLLLDGPLPLGPGEPGPPGPEEPGPPGLGPPTPLLSLYEEDFASEE